MCPESTGSALRGLKRRQFRPENAHRGLPDRRKPIRRSQEERLSQPQPQNQKLPSTTRSASIAMRNPFDSPSIQRQNKTCKSSSVIMSGTEADFAAVLMHVAPQGEEELHLGLLAGFVVRFPLGWKPGSQMLTDRGQGMHEAEVVNDAGKEIWEQDRRHFLHPFTHFESFRESGSLIISEGAASEVTDANGQTYIDAIGGLWCTNIGLGRDEMAQAIADQVRKLAYTSSFVDMSNEPAAVLSARLAELAPGDLNRVHFATGGSTAVDSAFRLVQFYQTCNGKPDKIHMIARRQAYHGSTFATMSLGFKKADRVPEFRYVQDTIHHVSAPDIYRAPDGTGESDFCDFLIAEFEAKIAELGADRVGGFFAEPVMGAGGVLVPPKDYLKRMREVCREHDILYVSDEVVTAFGRLGHWFASHDEFGIVPDIITSAKGLSSGYLPIGAVIYSDRVHDVMSHGDPGRWFASGFTYSGHPVCCAAALKNIEIMERENLLAHAQEVGEYFGDKLSELKGLPLVGDVRGLGLMRCVENVLNRETKEMFPESVKIGKRISTAAEALGVLVRPVGHLNVMSPPLVITREEIDFVVSRLAAAIKQVHADLVKEGWNPV